MARLIARLMTPISGAAFVGATVGDHGEEFLRRRRAELRGVAAARQNVALGTDIGNDAAPLG